MSNTLNVDVEGFDQLINRLKQIDGDKTKRREALIILRQIAKPTLAAAKREVPVSKKAHWVSGEKRTKKKISPGNLKKSLGTITAARSENPQVVVGARVKRSFDGWYAHFVHEPVNTYRVGYKRIHKRGANEHAAIAKRWRSNPFLTRAYKQTEGKVTKEAEAKFGKFVQRRLNKLQ